MVRTRAHRNMERGRLENLSMEQLRVEAQKYHLAATGDRNALIDGIMTYLERYNPEQDTIRWALGSGPSGRSEALPTPQIPTIADQPDEGSTPRNQVRAEEPSATVIGNLQQMMSLLTASMLHQQQETHLQFQKLAEQQQRQSAQLAQLLMGQSQVEAAGRQIPTTASEEPSANTARMSSSSQPNATFQQRSAEGMSAGSAISWLASQIPEFGGGDEDNVLAWICRVDKVSQIHGATDGMTLLAASSRLVKSARRWYEIQTGPVLESWIGLRQELSKIFDRKVPFYKAMQTIEARRWNHQKESFDQYAIEKLALMHKLNLPEKDSVNLLIGGIMQNSLRATALSVSVDTIEEFLEKMRHITQGAMEWEKKPMNTSTPKNKEFKECKNCGKKGHVHRDCRGETTCFFCKAKGHRQFDCPKKKEVRSTQQKPTTVPAVANVTIEASAADEVAAVSDPDYQMEIDNPHVRINSLEGRDCELSALVDTGSPVSFVNMSVFEKYIKPFGSAIIPAVKKLRNLSDHPINVLGVVRAKLTVFLLKDIIFDIELYVMKNDAFKGDLILGRDFLEKKKITLVYKPSTISENNRVSLFSYLPLCIVDDSPKRALEETMETNVMDVEQGYRQRLKELLLKIEGQKITPITDDYTVQVRLKDDSVYAYAPRRFAYSERLQIREITDDLLKRGIIQPSISPYCARIVPVRKKSGQMRLCVDLRPLNNRVEKQKYPFPLMEDCLSRLSRKSVFTLLDLKDGFHQIKVHPDSTKYFSFATPDGQYEYLYLPFGYSEAPAEFQKRIIQILNRLIREDKVILYMDDIFIATESVEENLTVIEQVLMSLKTYGLELNLAKSQFLKEKIEFLGYIISANGITLSPRHTEAVKIFKQPTNVHEVQRFLGLTSYFRKFIKDYALKAKPLQDLLKKAVDFNFDNSCIESFELLKRELISSPVLRLYDPFAETELHTDACNSGLGAILLQKQKDNAWAPVAYYSCTTNQAERNYHSFELEMLAIVKAVERFHSYLYGLSFTIITDCNAIVYAVNKANLNPRIARWTLTLQNYNFKILHRPGRRMAHADALSRSVGYVNALPLEGELELRQFTDPRIVEISRELEFKDSDKFALINGLVYKKDQENLKFVVPESMITNLLRAHHDEMAHCGVEKTLKGIEQNYWFPSKRKKVCDYIENCFTCLMSNYSTHRLEGEMHVYQSPQSPLEIMHLDHFGPLQESVDGYKHILVAVDAFTRFTWLFPTKSTGTKEVLNCLRTIFDTFGKPSHLVSDRGTAFTSREFSNFVESCNIKHRKIAVAAPWANGLAERINRFLKSSLTKMIGSPQDWKQHLGMVQYIINNTHHSAIKSNPSKLMLGYEQKNHSDFELTRFIQELTKIDSNLEEERKDNRDAARKATEIIRNYNKEYRDEKFKKPTLYNVGDYVLIRNTRDKPGESSKLKTNYKGPYLIAQNLGNNRYVVKDIPGFNQTPRPLDTILSSDRIKPWIKAIIPANETNDVSHHRKKDNEKNTKEASLLSDKNG